MKADKKIKLTIEIKPINDVTGKYIVRVMEDGVCMVAPRENTINEALVTAGDYVTKFAGRLKGGKATITIIDK